MNSILTKKLRKIITNTASVLLFTGIGIFLTSMKVTTDTDAIIGKWESVNKEFTWEFSKSEGTYNAKLITSKDALEEDGKTFKKDLKNPDPIRATNSPLAIFSEMPRSTGTSTAPRW